MWRHALFTDIWRKTTPPGKTKNGFRDARRENGENGSHTLTHTPSHTHTHTLSLTSTLSHVHTCLVSIRSNSVWAGQFFRAARKTFALTTYVFSKWVHMQCFKRGKEVPSNWISSKINWNLFILTVILTS